MFLITPLYYIFQVHYLWVSVHYKNNITNLKNSASFCRYDTIYQAPILHGSQPQIEQIKFPTVFPSAGWLVSWLVGWMVGWIGLPSPAGVPLAPLPPSRHSPMDLCVLRFRLASGPTFAEYYELTNKFIRCWQLSELLFYFL